ADEMSRVDTVKSAVMQGGARLRGSVAASDAFFPFRDGLDAVADAGATAVVQPGGSVRDEDVIAAADERGLAMVFTGRRHFRHGRLRNVRLRRELLNAILLIAGIFSAAMGIKGFLVS